MQGLPHLLDLADTFIAQLKSQLQQAAQEKAALEARVAQAETKLEPITATFCLEPNSRGMLCNLPPAHDEAHYYVGDGEARVAELEADAKKKPARKR